MKYIKAKAKHIIRRCLNEKTNEADKVNGYAVEINQLIDEAYHHGYADATISCNNCKENMYASDVCNRCINGSEWHR